MTAAGYLVAAAAPNIWVLLAAFALLIGPGATIAGTLPATVLASRWFEHRQGRAVGLVNMPLFVMLAPIVAVTLLEQFGVRALYLALAAVQLLTLPAALGVKDPGLTAPARMADATPGPVASEGPRLRSLLDSSYADRDGTTATSLLTLASLTIGRL